MVWAVKPIESYRPQGAHAEFGKGFDVEPGQILALDEEQIIDVTRPPIASIESIFEIVSSDEVAEGKFDVDTESDRLIVSMGEKTYQLVQGLRETDDVTRDVIMNSLYVPVVMQILDQLARGHEQFEQYRWFHPFRARCEIAGVNIDEPDLLNDAQRLLEQPFASLERLVPENEEERDRDSTA
jgi:hypothetical protein